MKKGTDVLATRMAAIEGPMDEIKVRGWLRRSQTGDRRRYIGPHSRKNNFSYDLAVGNLASKWLKGS